MGIIITILFTRRQGWLSRCSFGIVRRYTTFEGEGDESDGDAIPTENQKRITSPRFKVMSEESIQDIELFLHVKETGDEIDSEK